MACLPTYKGVRYNSIRELKEFVNNRPKKEGDAEFNRANLTEEEKWFKERYPEIPFSVVKSLIDNRAMGSFSKAGVILWEGAEEGTVYHEAFHVTEELLLTLEQKENIDKETKKRYPELKTILERKEQRAEDFRDYILTGENPYSKGPLADFFSKIYNLVKGLFTDSTTMTEIFSKIKANNLGRYKMVSPNSFQGKLYSLTPEQNKNISDLKSIEKAYADYTNEQIQAFIESKIPDSKSNLKNAKVISTTTAKNILDSLNGGLRENFKNIINELLKIPSFADRVVNYTELPVGNSLGFYDSLNDFLGIDILSKNESNSKQAKVLVEEIIHSLTSRPFKIKSGLMSGVLSTSENEFILKVDKLRNEVLKQRPQNKNDYYGLSNNEEFITRAFVDDSFQEFLGRIEVERTNVFSKIIEFVKELLGNYVNVKNNSALQEILGLTEEFIINKSNSSILNSPETIAEFKEFVGKQSGLTPEQNKNIDDLKSIGPDNQDFNKKLITFFNNFGIAFKEGDSSVDILRKIVYINPANEDQDFINSSSKLLTQLLQASPNINFSHLQDLIEDTAEFKDNIKKQPEIEKVYDYLKTGSRIPVDEWVKYITEYNKIKNPILEKFLQESLLDAKNNNSELHKFINKFLQWFKDLFSSAKNLKEITDAIISQVLVNNKEIILGDNNLQGKERVTLEKALSESKHGENIIKFLSSEGLTLVGSVAVAEQGSVYRKLGHLMHDIDWAVPFDYTGDPSVKLLTEFKGSQIVREFDSPTYYTKTYIVPPKGYKVTNMTFFKPDEFGENKYIASYDVVDSKGKVVSNYRRYYDVSVRSNKVTENREVYNEGLQNVPKDLNAASVDLFYNKEEVKYQPIKTKLSDGTEIKISHWLSAFTEKLKYGRNKDLVDWVNFTTNTFKNNSLNSPETTADIEDRHKQKQSKVYGLQFEEGGETIKLSTEHENEIMRGITSYFLNNMLQFKEGFFFDENTDPKDVYDAVRYHMENDMGIALEEKYSEEENPEGIDEVKNYYTIFNNWDKVVEAHTQYMKYNYGVEAAMDEESISEVERSTNDYAFLKEAYTFSTKDHMPHLVKMVIASLRETGSSPNYGLEQSVNPGSTHDYMMNLAHSSYSWAELKSKLLTFSDSRPELSEFVEKIEKLGQNAITETLQHFSQTKTSFLLGLVEDGEYRVIDANRNKLSAKIRKEWESSLMNIISGTVDPETKNRTLPNSAWAEIENLAKSLNNPHVESWHVFDRILNQFGIYTKTPSMYSDKEVYSMAGKPDTNIREIVSNILEYSDKADMGSLFSRSKGSVGGQIDYLVSKVVEKSKEAVELQHFNVDGTSVYDIGLNTYFSLLTNSWNSSNLDTFPQFNDVYSKNSVIKKRLLEGKKITHFFHEGVKNSKSPLVSVELSKMSPKDRAKKMVIDTLKGIYSFNRASDRKVESGFLINNGELLYNTTEEAYKAFRGYLVDEINFVRDRKGSNTQYVESNMINMGFFQDILKINDLGNKLQIQDIIEHEDFNIAERVIESKKELIDGALKVFFDSQKNYLKQILGEDIKSYKDEELDKFIHNYIGFNIETTKVFTGHPAYYKNTTDFFKRMSLYNATKKISRVGDVEFEHHLNKNYKRLDKKDTDRDIIKTITIKDIITSLAEEDLEDIVKLFSKTHTSAQVSAIKEEYQKANEANAQGWITLDEYRETHLRSKSWSDKLEALYQKEISGQGISLESLSYFPPLKTQYVGPDVNDISRYNPVSFKHSLLPLVPSVIKDTKLETISSYMTSKKIGILQTGSATKFGALINEGGNLHSLYTEGDGFITFEGAPEQLVNYKYFGIQLDIAPKVKTDITEGTQINKIALSNISDDGIFQNEELKALHEDYIKLNTDITNTLLESVESSMGIKIGVDGEVSVKDVTALKNYLIENITKRGANNNILSELDSIRPGKLDHLQSKKKIYDMVSALYNKKIISKKRSGSGHVQVSSSFFETKDTVRNTKFNSFLAFYKINEVETVPMEVITALPKNLYHIAEKLGKGDITKGVEIINEKYLSDPKYKDLFTWVGFRIPTQSLSSAEVFTIKKFLSPVGGDITIVPSAITVKAGSDFDIDKLNIYMPSFKVVDGKLVEDTQGVEGMFNKKLKIEKKLLLHPDNASQLLYPVLDKGSLYNNTQRIRKLEESSKGKRVENSYTDLFTLKANMTAFESFLSGKKGVGVTALQITHNTISQLYGIKIEADIFTEHNNKDGYVDFSQRKNKDGRLISEVLSEFLTAYVDVSKDPYIFDMNGYIEVSNVMFYLIRSGVSVEWAISFMNQPIIKSYVQEIRNTNSIFKESDKKDWDIQKDLIKKYKGDPYKLLSYYNGKIKGLEFAAKEYLPGLQKVEALVSVNLPDMYSNKELKTKEYLNTPLTNADLESEIKNPSQENQIKAFDQFIVYLEDSRRLSEVVTSSSLDTNGVSNISTIISNRLNTIARLSGDKKIRGYSRSMRGYYKPYKEVIERAMSLFVDLFTLDSYDIHSEFIKMAEQHAVDRDKFLILLRSEFTNYLVNTIGSVTNGTININRDLHRLFFGDNSLAVRLSNIKKNQRDPLYGNHAITQLVPIIKSRDTRIGDQDNIIMYNNKRTVYEENMLISAFSEIESLNPDLAKDIIKASYYQSGDTTSPFTYSSLIPPESHQRILNEALVKFNNMGRTERKYLIKNFLDKAFPSQNPKKISAYKEPISLTTKSSVRNVAVFSYPGMLPDGRVLDSIYILEPDKKLQLKYHKKEISDVLKSFKVSLDPKTLSKGDGYFLTSYGLSIDKEVERMIKEC